MKAPSILIYGYGNPGRKDDGLGNALVERMEDWARDNARQEITFDSNYQLNIEDAEAIADKDLVIFADASTEREVGDFTLTPVDQGSRVTFTTHSASPGYVVDLCRQLYERVPATYLLHIRGYDWSIGEGLSPRARANLSKALEYLKERLESPQEMIGRHTGH